MRRETVMRRWAWVCVLGGMLAACKGDKAPEAQDAGPVETGPSALTEAEPNERPDQALSVTRDSTVTADLAAQPNKADEDWYRLAPSGGGLQSVALAVDESAPGAVGLLDTRAPRGRMAARCGGRP